MYPTDEQLDSLVKRILTAQNPLRVVLYGSSVRGQMRDGSDIDVMVVVPNGSDRRKVAKSLHRSFLGLPFPVDVIVATPALLERHRNNAGLIYRTIIAEGRDVYAA